MYEIVPDKGLMSDNARILEITPIIYIPDGRMLAFPSAFFPFDGQLIGLTPEYVIGHKYQGNLNGRGPLPPSNAFCSHLDVFYAVHEGLSTMQPRTLDEIRGEILMGTLARGGRENDRDN